MVAEAKQIEMTAMELAVFHAHRLIDKGVKPKGFKYKILQKVESIKHQRYITYFDMFAPTGINLSKLYVIYNEEAFTYAVLMPVFTYRKEQGQFPDEIYDYNEVLESWYERFLTKSYDKDELTGYLADVEEELRKVPVLKDLVEEEIYHLSLTYYRANQLAMAHHAYVESDDYVEFLEDSSEQYKEWKRSSLEKRFSTLQRQVVENIYANEFILHDEAQFFSDEFNVQVTIDREAYRTFIEKYGTAQEKALVEQKKHHTKYLENLALDMDEYFMHGTDVYGHLPSVKHLKIPMGYTGKVYTVGLQVVPSEAKYIARTHRFVEGDVQEDIEHLYFEELKELDDWLGDGLDGPLFLVESGDLSLEIEQDDVRNDMEFVETMDYSFQEEVDAYWEYYFARQDLGEDDT